MEISIKFTLPDCSNYCSNISEKEAVRLILSTLVGRVDRVSELQDMTVYDDNGNKIGAMRCE